MMRSGLGARGTDRSINCKAQADADGGHEAARGAVIAREWGMTAKRSFDLFVTILASVAWIPALLLTALVVLIREGRPIFYVSPRIVGPGKTRRVVKFRTMVRDAERVYNRSTVPVANDGVRFLNLPPDSPLYTSTGRLIERIAFTELPQLLLVLRGHMSL